MTTLERINRELDLPSWAHFDADAYYYPPEEWEQADFDDIAAEQGYSFTYLANVVGAHRFEIVTLRREIVRLEDVLASFSAVECPECTVEAERKHP